MTDFKSNDPIEQIVGSALQKSGYNFTTDDHIQNLGLDFYIPKLDLHIEVKAYHTDRVLNQMKRVNNIIVIVGIDAAKNFSKLIKGIEK